MSLRPVFLVAMVLLSGCAFSVYDVKVDYQYDQPVDLNLSDSASRIRIAEFKDTRSVANPRLIMNQQNLYGDTTSGGYQAEKEISAIVHDAFVQALGQAQAQLVDSEENVVLQGELMDLRVDPVMGMWEGSWNSRMTVKLKLIDASTGNALWSDTFIGAASTKAKDGSAGVLSDVLDNLVSRVMSDSELARHLKPAAELSKN
jgi:hypothetical protein